MGSKMTTLRDNDEMLQEGDENMKLIKPETTVELTKFIAKGPPSDLMSMPTRKYLTLVSLAMVVTGRYWRVK